MMMSQCHLMVIFGNFEFSAYFCQNKQNQLAMIITINKNDIVSIYKSARRQAAIESGSYGRFNNKVFKDKKTYSRKSKHKKTQL